MTCVVVADTGMICVVVADTDMICVVVVAGTGMICVVVADTDMICVVVADTDMTCVVVADTDMTCVVVADTDMTCVVVAGTDMICVVVAGTDMICVVVAGTDMICVVVADTDMICVVVADTDMICVVVADTDMICVVVADTDMICVVVVADTGMTCVVVADTDMTCVVVVADTDMICVVVADTDMICVVVADTDMTGAEMWSTYYQMTVTQLIQESLVKLCMEHVPWSDTLEIDGIVCIARGDDSKQLVVKIHQVLDVTSQKESKHLLGDCDKDESHVDTKMECSSLSPDDQHIEDTADALVNDRTIDAIETPSTDIGGVQSGVQSGRDLVPVAPTTPIWRWRSSSLPCPGVVEPQSERDVDGTNDDDAEPSPLSDQELTCKKCGATFCGVSQLQSHTAKAHSRYMCRHCLNTFSLRCNLRRHERLHAGLKPYSCDVCSKSFARSTDLKIHLARHAIGTTASPLTCSRCPKTFTGLSSLRWHMYKTHQQQDSVQQCGVCSQVFFDHVAYQAHCKLHVATTPGDASVGDTVTADESLVDDGDSDGTSCQKTDAAVTAVTVTAACPAMVSILKMNVTQRHGARHDVSTNGSWQLDKLLDQPVLSLPQSLSKSVSQSTSQSVSVFDGRTIPGISHVTVGDTGKRLLTQLLMTAADARRSKRRKGRPVKHVASPDVICSDRSDSDESDVSVDHPSECRTNGTEKVDTLSRDNSLTLPQVETPLSTSTPTPSNNQDIKPVICDVQSLTTPSGPQPVDTDVQTKTEVTVSAPDGNTSETDKPSDTSSVERKGYICNRLNCGKVFVGFSKYELHYIEKHDRYPCHFCDNSFTGRNNRIRHEKSHTGGKSYRCKDCARMFSRPDSLREHQFTHTASYREQKCRICGATYDKKAQLLSHMKKCFRGMRIVDYSTDSVEVRLPKRVKKEDESTLVDSFAT